MAAISYARSMFQTLCMSVASSCSLHFSVRKKQQFAKKRAEYEEYPVPITSAMPLTDARNRFKLRL